MIEFRDVTKVYRSPLGRSVRAVEGFSLQLARGQVMGLAGPNGAGKSTLINLLLGYLRPTAGVITIDGLLPRPYVQRRGIGYMSELVAIPPGWTVEGALRRYALLAGIGDAEQRPCVERAITLLGLEEHRRKRVRQLSKGNAQRLGLAQALLRDEAVVILDEPTHGLDPVWTQNFREIVRGLRDPGRVVLIASHNLDELERVSDCVAIIDHGRLQRVVDVRASGPRAAGTRYRLVLAAGGESVAWAFPHAKAVGGGAFEVAVEDLAALNRGIAAIIARGALVSAIVPAQASLERQFREAIGARPE